MEECQTGVKYFPGGRDQHCGKFRHHATVEGPQNWPLVNVNGLRQLGPTLSYLQPTLVVNKSIWIAQRRHILLKGSLKKNMFHF